MFNLFLRVLNVYPEEALPISVGFELVVNHSIKSQANPPHAAATLVTKRAFAAIPSAAS